MDGDDDRVNICITYGCLRFFFTSQYTFHIVFFINIEVYIYNSRLDVMLISNRTRNN